MPLDSAYPDGEIPTLALNLWASRGYSLFSGRGPKKTHTKPLLYDFVSGTVGKTTRWQTVIGGFENSRVFPSLSLFYFILFVCILLIKRVQWLSWLKFIASTSKTWVRVPGLCNISYYFAIQTPMQLQYWGSPYTTMIQTSTRPTNSNQRRGCKEHAMSRSTRLHTNWKGQTNCKLIGPEC